MATVGNLFKLTLLCILLSAFSSAEPTGVRDWKSTAGTNIHASAEKVVDGKVSFKAADGRLLMVPIEKLSPEDRDFLKNHFAIKERGPGEPTSSAVPPLKADPAYPAGQVSGPIDAGEGSHYFVYVPKSLREARKAPLMFVTPSGGGNANAAKMYAEAAELAGFVLASSVESKNGRSFDANHAYAKRCVAHLLANLPIDEDRVYFTGNSGGGAMSFYNALRIKSAGNMPLVAYSLDRRFVEGQYCYGIGGTRDFNRYATAYCAAQFKDRGFHRIVPGGHGGGAPWVACEGMLWLDGRYLGDHRQDPEYDAERLDYEAAMITWMRALSVKKPYRAHYWCTFLNEEYKISGPNAAPVAGLLAKLNADPMNARYTAGLAAINKFSQQEYAPIGASGGSPHKHTTPQIRKAAEKVAAEYEGVPLIEEITSDLGSPTV